MFRQRATVVLLRRFYTLLLLDLGFGPGACTGLFLTLLLTAAGGFFYKLLHEFVVRVVVDSLLLGVLVEATLRCLHHVSEEAVVGFGGLLAGAEVVGLSFQTLVALLIRGLSELVLELDPREARGGLT